MSNGSEIVAIEINNVLTVGKNFTLPPIDFSDAGYELPAQSGPLYEAVDRIQIEDLTTKTVNGSGVFDALMTTISAHLHVEYEKNRITGAEYSKAYTASMGAAMQTAIQFLLGKDQAYWQALMVQSQAQAAQVALITARVGLLTAKVQAYLIQFQAITAEANYALTKLKLATEDQQFALLASQTNLADAQLKLVNEQVEAARGQTVDTRTDGSTITGAMGKQKELLDQQITSYKRDAETKAAKMFVDAWITQKTIDEGLLAPTAFTNVSLDAVLGHIKTNNQLT